jgi:hypothetical protein
LEGIRMGKVTGGHRHAATTLEGKAHGRRRGVSPSGKPVAACL